MEAGTLCVECCGYTTLFTHSTFQSIEKKAFQRRIKESPWRGRKVVFKTAVSLTVHQNQSICVIFGAPDLVESVLTGKKMGLTAGVGGNFGESHVSKNCCRSKHLSFSFFLLRRCIITAIVIVSRWFFGCKSL